MIQVIKISGKARVVFALIAELAKHRGNETLGEIIKRGE